MSKTRHFQSRMSQRAIEQGLVNLVLEFGAPGPDGKLVLNRKALESLCTELSRIQKQAQKALNKGGIVVVADGAQLITTYRLGSFDRKRAA